MENLQVDDEGMVDLCQNIFLKFDVVHLLQVDYLSLFKRLECDWFPIKQRQVYFTKCSGADDPDQVEVGDLSVGILYISASELGAAVATRHH